MKRKMTAFLSAAALCLTALPLGAAAEETQNLPEWVPVSFSQALQFYNAYGQTHVADGYVCTVQKKRLDIRYLYSTEWNADLPQPEPVYQETLILREIPLKPDEADTEAYLAYQQELERLGVSERELEYVELRRPDFVFEVSVYQPEADMAFTWVEHLNQWDTPEVRTDFSFAVDGDTIRETDLYAFLPDSLMEFEQFRSKNPVISLQNGYVVYCDKVGIDGGGQVMLGQTGTAKLEQVLNYNCAKTVLIAMEVGGGGETVIVYKPVTSGTVMLRGMQAQPWNLTEVWTKDAACFAVSEDLAVTEISEEQMGQLLMGDCNNDGVFSVADVLMCQKYVHGLSELTAWEHADFDGDGTVDVFDLTLMRRALLMQEMANPEQIAFETLTSTIHRDDDVVNHRYFKARAAYSLEELQDLAGEAEIPEEITQETFTNNVVIMLETPISGGNVYQNMNVEEITRVGATLRIQATARYSGQPTPDMAYWRKYLTIPLDSVASIKGIKVTCTTTKVEE